MTKQEEQEFKGFTKAKRQICQTIETRIEVLEETRGDYVYILQREAVIKALENLRQQIRNTHLYRVRSKSK
jgi:hypothetical protein